MIDLHAHTDRSDGEFSPAGLIEEARRAGVSTLGITDHDTFAGYDQAREAARSAGIDLLCGIELSTSLHGQPVHLLGYFVDTDPGPVRSWIVTMQEYRMQRNRRLAARLQELGVDVTLEDAASRGSGLIGRVHFAKALVEKGYVRTVPEAFTRYLGEHARAYVPLIPVTFADAAQRIRETPGVASLAHPVRVRGDVSALLPELLEAGVNAIEAYHSDHTRAQTECYLALAKRYGLQVTGGSDFHGPHIKPDIHLGTGRRKNLRIPEDLMERLRNRPKG